MVRRRHPVRVPSVPVSNIALLALSPKDMTAVLGYYRPISGRTIPGIGLN